ncbi:MAG: sialate O-acetylesterase [Planctomycetota bacterium]|nr:sialate O-acetylesterase [Planctomycetota bacterium]
MTLSIRSLFLPLALGLSTVPVAAQSAPVRVYVLAGQSNMEGKAQNKLLDHQATAEGTREFFAHLRDGDGWAVRDDVHIQFLERRGPLTIGYGSRDRTGVELEFGTVMGERFEAPVLLIKTAWGGRSIVRDFRPPSAGMPSDEALAKELEQAQKRVQNQIAKDGKERPLPTMEEIRAAYGRDYRAMLDDVRTTLAELDDRFPALAGRKTELCGFVWFQGWNDQYNGAELEYEANLRHLITDVRRDLGSEDLPVVVGLMGQNGSEPAKGAMATIQAAQAAVADMPAVRSVRTDVLVDEAAEALYPTWKENFEAWERTGSDHRYHYLGSAIWFTRIGRAFAEAMLGIGED